MSNNIEQYYDGDTPINESEYVEISINNSVDSRNSNATTEQHTYQSDYHDDSFASIGYNYADYEYEDYSALAIDAERRRQHNILCIISLACMFGVPIVGGILGIIFSGGIGTISAIISAANSSTSGMPSSNVGSLGSMFGSFISSAGRIAGIVLMIVARVRYKEGVFGKVIMWIYIGLAALSIVISILTVIFVIVLIGVIFGALF